METSKPIGEPSRKAKRAATPTVVTPSTRRTAKPKSATSSTREPSKPTAPASVTTRIPKPKVAASRKTIVETKPNENTSLGTETIEVSQTTPQASPYQELRIWSEMLRDAMQARISATNRSERGGVHPDLYVNHIRTLEKTEHDCALELVRTYRKTVSVDIRTWQVNSPGIGEHLLARLLGVIGHPCLATPYHWEGSGKDERRLVADEPFTRSISQLWSYCGVGDPDRQRHKGQSVEEAMACGIPMAKSILFLLATSCVKVNRGPYRAIYDSARVVYASRVHRAPCLPCGPKGKPAKEGSEWSLAHQHAAALRKVGKEILRDLWAVSQPLGQ